MEKGRANLSRLPEAPIAKVIKDILGLWEVDCGIAAAPAAATAKFARVGYTLGTLCIFVALLAGAASAQPRTTAFRLRRTPG